MEMLAFALALATAFPFEIGEVLVPAYLDAGTGSLIFQVLVASLVSAGVVFGGAIVYLRSFFSRVVLRRPSSSVVVRRSPSESVGVRRSPSESSASEGRRSSDEATLDSPSEHVADDRQATPKSDGHHKAA